LSVSKGSINRVNRIKETSQPNKNLRQHEENNPTKTYFNSSEKQDKIYEQKFKVISNIKQDMPDYLL
jgi:hypothetical protein